jgi:Tol biopolymer transport system component/tRNA A-37 threonylcarbamoyl transferase component Bud32
MALIGRTLGHYRIDERLGAGGMGVVYKARDTRLDRTVALKLLSEQPAGDAATRSRLMHEARSASGLNHPNVCTVHEVGEADGQTFIVMEFVDGTPLDRAIPPGGMPTELVCRYGMQIASALEHAHERGVIHRDLKGANVILTADGRAKVLDFGLALRTPQIVPEAATRSDVQPGPTEMAGTLAYLSPEVLLGKPATPQTDIWTLGVLLYEMAGGKQPFQGQNSFEITAAILRAPTPPLPVGVPPGIAAVISRCLSKDPAERYRHAGEVHAALEAVHSSSSHVTVAVPAEFRPPGRRRPALLAAIGIGVLGLIGAGAWLALSVWRAPDGPPVGGGRTTLLLSSDTVSADPALSPDGKMLVYVAIDDQGRSDLFLTRVAGGGRVQLTNDDAREFSPAFSPDGERIAFTRQAAGKVVEIAVVSTLGGDLNTVITAATQPAWSPDGLRLAFMHRPAADKPVSLSVAAVDGSGVKSILAADGAYPFVREPAWAPDGRSIAFVRGVGGSAGEIWIVPVGGGEPRRLSSEQSGIFSARPVFTKDGRGLVYSSNLGGATNIWYRGLDGSAPVRLTTGSGPDEWASVAGDGSIVFRNSRWRNALILAELPAGPHRSLATHTPFIWAPAFSPNGRQIAFSRGDADGAWHIWLTDVDGATPRRLTSGAGEVYPRFTPDGNAILYQGWSAPRRIWRVPVAGGAPVALTPDGGPDELMADVSPDGRQIVYVSANPGGERVYVAKIDGTGARLLLDAVATVPRWSPDGLRIAFSAERGYSGGILIVNADGTGVRRLTKYGGWPVWWPDGKRIGFMTIGPEGTQQVDVVSIDDGSITKVSVVRYSGTNFPFDVSADGKQYVTSNSVHVSDEIWLLGRR